MSNPKQPATQGDPKYHPSLRIRAELRNDLTVAGQRCPGCGQLKSNATYHP